MVPCPGIWGHCWDQDMSQLTAWTFTAQSLHGSIGEFATAHLLVLPQQPSAPAGLQHQICLWAAWKGQ